MIQIFASYKCRENSLKDLEKRESETNEYQELLDPFWRGRGEKNEQKKGGVITEPEEKNNKKCTQRLWNPKASFVE